MRLKNPRRLILFLLFVLFVFVAVSSNNKSILKAVYPIKYKKEVFKYAKEFGQDPLFVLAVIKAESNFDRYAVSSKGAKGLMQITDETGKWAAEKIKIKDFNAKNLFLPETNLRLGCWYLKWLGERFGGDKKLVIAAYNSGIGNVQDWLKDKEISSNGKTLENIPYDETDKYIKRVTREYEIFKYIYK